MGLQLNSHLNIGIYLHIENPSSVSRKIVAMEWIKFSLGVISYFITAPMIRAKSKHAL